MLDWQPAEIDNKWQAKDEIAKGFSVKYTIWLDEDDMWTGNIESRWLDHKDEPQYLHDTMRDYGIERLATVGICKNAVERFHIHQVRPEMERMYAEYVAANE